MIGLLMSGLFIAPLAVADEPATAVPEIDPPFDMVVFQSRTAVADWLSRYDAIAWTTSDLVMEEPATVLKSLGSEWFCLVHENAWHAVYGRYSPESGHYEVLLHYAQADDGSFQRSRDAIPQATVDPLGRALYIAGERLRPVLEPAGVRFNQYVRRIDGKQIEVWYLPAWQPDGRVVFGSEYHLVLDKKGRKIVRESVPELTLSDMRPEEGGTWLLRNENADLPSVGQLFTLLLVRGHVKLAGIRNRAYTTVYIDTPGAGGDAWVNVANEYDLQEAVETIEHVHAEGDQ